MGRDELNELVRERMVRLWGKDLLRRLENTTSIDCGSGFLGTGMPGAIGFRLVEHWKSHGKGVTAGALFAWKR